MEYTILMDRLDSANMPRPETWRMHMAAYITTKAAKIMYISPVPALDAEGVGVTSAHRSMLWGMRRHLHYDGFAGFGRRTVALRIDKFARNLKGLNKYSSLWVLHFLE
jgi:hypothetical protein